MGKELEDDRPFRSGKLLKILSIVRSDVMDRFMRWGYWIDDEYKDIWRKW